MSNLSQFSSTIMFEPRCAWRWKGPMVVSPHAVIGPFCLIASVVVRAAVARPDGRKSFPILSSYRSSGPVITNMGNYPEGGGFNLVHPPLFAERVLSRRIINS
jgi:hypothetical protein